VHGAPCFASPCIGLFSPDGPSAESGLMTAIDRPIIAFQLEVATSGRAYCSACRARPAHQAACLVSPHGELSVADALPVRSTPIGAPSPSIL